MKKNVSLITVSISFAKWLTENLLKTNNDEAVEIAEGIEDILKGKSDIIMINVSDNVEQMEDCNIDFDDIIRAGKLEINPKSRRVTINNEDVILTPKEFDILYFLAKNKGSVFTKEQIYQAVWEEDYFLADSNIMAFIRKLRKKIEPNPDEPEYIITIWGIGYKFNDNI